MAAKIKSAIQGIKPKQMKFSIIIALAPERTAPVLQDIKHLDYSENSYEVIVEKGYNPSANRNRGIKKAKHEILLFLDDDCNIEPDLLKKAEKIFAEHNPDILGGPQLTPKDDNFFAKSSGYVISSWFGSNKMSVRYKKSKINLDADENSLTSAVCFIKKSVFEKTKGFNEKLFPGEDPELFARLKSLGFKLVYHPEIYVYHKRRPNLAQFIKQFYNYGKSSVQGEKTKSTKLALFFIMPGLAVAYTLLIILLAFAGIILKLATSNFSPEPWTTLLWLSPFIIYILIVIIMSAYLGLKNKALPAFFIMPFIFIAEHASYGFGMLAAMFKKNKF